MKKSSSSPLKTQLIALYRRALLADIPFDVVQDRMSTYLLRSEVTADGEALDDKRYKEKIQKKVPRAARLITGVGPFVFILVGAILVGNALWPIISYYLFIAPSLRADTLAAPIPNNEVLDAMPHSIAQAQTVPVANTAQVTQAAQDEPKIIKDELDYTNLSNWFTSKNLVPATAQSDTEYQLEIPAVNIQEASVHIGGSDLDKSLIQYPGTALPGQSGSAVIFGHSVLRQFYNPQARNPRRYFSIFSKIMTLQNGDLIYIKQGNVKYTYSVVKKSVVQPEDTFILDQRYDVKQIKLVTCVPEGTYLERGVVTAELVSSQ